jgi:hypothetical protein
VIVNPKRIIIPREDEDDAWVQVRSPQQRMSGGERKSIYKYLDETEGGNVYKQYLLLRRIAAHLIHSWSIDLPAPRVQMDKGKVVGYSDEDSFDALDDDVETIILAYANEWANKIALNFAADPEPSSPTKPSDDSRPVSEAPAG